MADTDVYTLDRDEQETSVRQCWSLHTNLEKSPQAIGRDNSKRCDKLSILQRDMSAQ